MNGADLTTLAVGQSVFLFYVIILSIVIAAACNATGGSALPAIIIHGGSNVWSKAFGENAPSWFTYLDLRMIFMIIAASVIIAIAGPRLFYVGQTNRSK